MSANLRAFLAVLRECEGTGDALGYCALYGHTSTTPHTFSLFDDHPRIARQTPWGWTSAAGAYQFMAVSPIPGGGSTKVNTWDRAKEALGLPDFLPESQDRAAIWLIETDAKDGALADIEAGRLREALAKCAGIWASLPGSPHGQPTRTYEFCEKVFLRAGGQLAEAPTMVPDDKPAPSVLPKPVPVPAPKEPWRDEGFIPPKESPMALPIPALIALGAELLKVIPWGKKRIDRIEEAAPVLVEIAKTVVPEARNEQEAVVKVLSDQETQANFVAKVAVKWDDVAPFMEHEAKERAAARGFAEQMTGSGPAWRAAGFGFLLLILAVGVVYGGGYVLGRLLFADSVDLQTKGMIIGAIIAFVTQVLSYFFGSSASSRNKDQALADAAKR